MNVLVVIGTRPEAIKMAPVVRALDASPRHRRTLCAVQQQPAWLEGALSTFALVPDLVVGAGAPDADPAERLAHVLSEMRGVLARVRPDVVLVHGDTTTALAAALATFYARIPLTHVEAGLRSFDLGAPWPEEGHRVTIDALSQRLLVPSERARENLLAERVDPRRIVVTGNPIVDAFEHVLPEARTIALASIEGLGALPSGARLVTVTCHRREQHGAGLERIAGAIARAAKERDDLVFAWPLHAHPAARDPIRLRLADTPNARVLPPLSYPSFLALLAASTLVVTDSGGVQEEAPLLGRPLLVARDRTERPEVIASGAGQLVGTSEQGIVSGILALVDDAAARERMTRAAFPYGTVGAAQRIVQALTLHG